MASKKKPARRLEAKAKKASKTRSASSPEKGPPKTIDELIARAAPEQRAALEKLRGQLRTLVPGAEECISYGQAGLRVGGKAVLWFGAAKKHLSLFPGAVVESFAKELRDFDISKGTIRFQPERPLPAPLLRRIVKAGVAAHTRSKN